MPMLSDRGWDRVRVEGGGDMHSGQMREWVGGRRKGFFHLVLRQGSDLGLDEWGVSFPKCELISRFPVEK